MSNNNMFFKEVISEEVFKMLLEEQNELLSYINELTVSMHFGPLELQKAKDLIKKYNYSE